MVDQMNEDKTIIYSNRPPQPPLMVPLPVHRDREFPDAIRPPQANASAEAF